MTSGPSSSRSPRPLQGARVDELAKATTGLDVVALQDLGGPSSLEAVKPVLLAQLASQFGLSPRRDAALPDVLAAA